MILGLLILLVLYLAVGFVCAMFLAAIGGQYDKLALIDVVKWSVCWLPYLIKSRIL